MNRLRRQSPFDGLQPQIDKFQPRRILSTHAHRKMEAYINFIFLEKTLNNYLFFLISL